jgi:hypothetical protein
MGNYVLIKSNFEANSLNYLREGDWEDPILRAAWAKN